MTTIVIKPKSKEEQDLLTELLKKMNIEAEIVEESASAYETRKAMDDVRKKKGTKAKNADELFNKLGI
ncbi:MAG: hypothetical protein V1775_09085 [Bacteroidota bacterium]